MGTSTQTERKNENVANGVLRHRWHALAVATLAATTLVPPSGGPAARAQGGVPTVVDPTLAVRTAVSDLETPISMAFLPDGSMLVCEKNTGRVQHVVDDMVANTALDLAVNNSSERGLLGIALDGDFGINNYVYLYWTCLAPPPVDPFTPSLVECPDPPELGADTSDILAVPLLGNRLDRFVWDGTNLTFDANLIKLRAFQNDGGPVPAGQGDDGQPPAGNHNGGVIRIHPRGGILLVVGDVGRRGQLQNLPSGPTDTGLGPTVPDDQFGGPAPDDAHLTGVILRLNRDGSPIPNNPFYAAGAAIGGEVGANIQKIYSYGVRNSFGMAVDHMTGNLWDTENGDDSFDELNLVEPGSNSGWIQIIGRSNRLDQFKSIETAPATLGLQQLRWPPTRIADSTAEAMSRLFVLPGSRYSEPEFSWKYAVAPAAIGFLRGNALGAQHQNDLFMGFSTPVIQGGPIFKFNLRPNRRAIDINGDRRIDDRVADNLTKHDITESESLLFGTGFGVVTDIHTGPNGSLYVVSISSGAIYEIHKP
jgi:glucose/arabinose dehydrogenase